MAVKSNVVRKPNATLTLNGETVSGLLSCEVDNNNFYAADEFRATLVLSKGKPWDFWASTPGIRAVIKMGEAGDEQHVITGEIDRCTTDPVANLVQINGRDLSCSLIDNRTRKTFNNFRVHNVAEYLADRHGLAAVVTETKQNYAGPELNNSSSEIDVGPSHWDLLTYLAQQTGRVLYVDKETLYFVAEEDLVREPYPLVWQGGPAGGGNPRAPVMRLELERNLVLAQRVVVEILSYDVQAGTPIVATAESSANIPITDERGRRRFKQVYSREIPDLNAAQANARARQLLEDITRHERRIRFVAPGDSELTVRSLIKLSGTGTSYDQDYYPDHIVRRWSADRGYTMRVRAKNHSPATVVSVGGIELTPVASGD